jgi:dipeptidyl aminopeptidase/acylaminoacyl peptidase
VRDVAASGEAAVLVGATPYTPPAVVRVDLADGSYAALSAARGDAGIDRTHVSVPRPLEFPTGGGETAHALFYPPVNPAFAGPAGQRPPLVVNVHGGPTAHVKPELSLAVQYWTTRGIAVVDVNYGGSTGYGRAYRERLPGRWGVVDVEDAVNAARALAGAGEVDGATPSGSSGRPRARRPSTGRCSASCRPATSRRSGWRASGAPGDRCRVRH